MLNLLTFNKFLQNEQKKGTVERMKGTDEIAYTVSLYIFIFQIYDNLNYTCGAQLKYAGLYVAHPIVRLRLNIYIYYFYK